jgi:superfamily II DNA or RNA helicase
MMTAPWRMSLTATPPTQPDHLKGFLAALGPIVHAVSLKELKGNILSQFEVRILSFKTNSETLLRHKTLLNQWKSHKKSLVDQGEPLARIFEISQRSKLGRQALLCLTESRKCLFLCTERVKVIRDFLEAHREKCMLIFTPDTFSAYALSVQLHCPAITAEIGGNERSVYLDAFKKGQIKRIISCRVLNEGYDLPEAEIALIVAPFSSKRDLTQRVGRVLRKKENKVALIQFFACENTSEMEEVMRCKSILMN